LLCQQWALFRITKSISKQRLCQPVKLLLTLLSVPAAAHIMAAFVDAMGIQVINNAAMVAAAQAVNAGRKKREALSV
jgi:UDP-N-acetylglucosamine enolpyruvyl transferase